jgi:hypothetical protein
MGFGFSGGPARVFAHGLLAGAVGASLAICFAWSLLRYRDGTAPPPADMEPAPEILQSDMSLVLERAPDPKAKPAHELPEGAVAERIVQVTIQPNAESLAIPKGFAGGDAAWLPRPLTLDLTLARMPDGGHRVVASTPDGMIVKGLDVPVSAPTFRNFRNAAGGTYTLGGGYGAWYHRALGERWTVGAQVRYAPARDFEPARMGADVLVGWRW